MKKYYFDEFTLIVGTDREIRSLYRRMGRHDFMPTFCDFPKFRSGGMYGIIINDDKYYVVNADTVVQLLMM